MAGELFEYRAEVQIKDLAGRVTGGKLEEHYLEIIMHYEIDRRMYKERRKKWNSLSFREKAKLLFNDENVDLDPNMRSEIADKVGEEVKKKRDFLIYHLHRVELQRDNGTDYFVMRVPTHGDAIEIGKEIQKSFDDLLRLYRVEGSFLLGDVKMVRTSSDNS
ncbi:hypothetical protein KY339_00160 [Candidatus Woesearchaeota archaeon]|nr:hypothetical protein [Candidatus Woesearchaeota archaeon]